MMNRSLVMNMSQEGTTLHKSVLQLCRWCCEREDWVRCINSPSPCLHLLSSISLYLLDCLNIEVTFRGSFFHHLFLLISLSSLRSYLPCVCLILFIPQYVCPIHILAPRLLSVSLPLFGFVLFILYCSSYLPLPAPPLYSLLLPRHPFFFFFSVSWLSPR